MPLGATLAGWSFQQTPKKIPKRLGGADRGE
jgi:hypothetical protein